MDMDKNTIKAVWGFNGTERPGAVYLASVLATHAQKGLPAFGIYGHDVQNADDSEIPADVKEKLLRFGRAAVGMCRRVTYDDGSGQMQGDVNTANFVSLEGGNDTGIELLYTFDKNKKLKGIVANIACPAQILEQRSFISADYWGRAKAIIREKLGSDICLLTLCGAGGDQCPRDLVRWVNPETPIDDPNVKRPNPLERKADPSMYDISGCNKVGKRVANEIISVYEDITEYKDEAVFQHKVLNIELPLRKATMEEYLIFFFFIKS